MSMPHSQSVYFVDASLADLDTLLTGLPEGAEVILLQPDQDGLAQMLAALAGREGIDALHVLTHGAAGSIDLGNVRLHTDTLDSFSEALKVLGQSLSEDGDILFYGCDVAADDAGKALIGSIAELTGADVAASIDLTGASHLGGDWDLEFRAGVVESDVMAVEAMDGVLASGIMRNAYIRFGYSDNGTLGYGGTQKPGIQYDKDGNRNFLDTADFLTPGSPWEMFAVKIGSSTYVNNNSSGATGGQMTTILKDTSLTTSGADTYGSITYESTAGGLKITQTYTLGQTSQIISMQVTIQNVSGSTINDVKYARGTDPDVDSNGLPGSTSSTNNVRGASGISANDIVLATGPVSGRVIGLYTDSSFTHNSGVTGWTTDPSTYLSGTNVGNGDNTIGLGFDLGSFVAGQSKTFSFAYVFAASAAALQASVDQVPKSNPAPTLTYFTPPVDTTNEDTAVTITYAELIAKGNEADLNADDTPGTVTGFVVKQVNNGTLTIGGSAWAIGSNDVITTGKDAVWTPSANLNGSSLTAFSVVARDAEGAVSASNVAVMVDVIAVNDRPTLVSNATLRAIAEDISTASNIGSTVADLFVPRFSDVDAGASLKAIVITANAETTLGQWQYSTDNGATWHDVGVVSAAAGLVLETTAKLRFAPDADKNGVPSALTVHALDNTYGTSFTSGATKVTYDTTTATATGPLSTNSVTLGVEVTSVNDAPVFTSIAATATVSETLAADAAVGSGVTLTATAGSLVTDDKLTGTLAATDVDHDSALLSFSIRGGSESGGVWTKQGLFGTLTLNADKTWSYELTEFDAINALPEGVNVTESFDFKVSDPDGASAVQALVISLTGTNDTPILAAAIPDQSLTGTGAWQYQIPAASFTDAEGSGLTYTVKVIAVDGAPLAEGDQYTIGASTSGGASVASSWLTFDEGSRTFTGNPPISWGNQSLTFEVTASDGTLSVADSFDLTISGNTNQPPVVANPLQWTAADAPKEVTTVTFGAALGGTTIAFDGSGDITLGSKATGDEVASAFSGGTTNYDPTSTTDNVVTLTAKVAGARADFTDGATVNILGGSYVVDVTTEGVNATTEVWKAQFVVDPSSLTTLTVLGQSVDLAFVDWSPESLVDAIVASFTATPNATWNITKDESDADTLVFTAKVPGNQPAINYSDFVVDGGPASNNGAFLNNDGLTETTTGADPIAEVVTLTFDGAYGGADITIDGTTQEAGSSVSANDVATAVRDATYTHYTTGGSGTDVVFTANTAGNQNPDLQASDFVVTSVGGQTLSVSPTVTTQGSGWAVQIPVNTFSDPDNDTLSYAAYTFTIDGSGARTYSLIPEGDSTVPTAGSIVFDADTLKVFGDGSVVGGQYIEIRATDAAGSNSTVFSQFQLVVYSNSQSASLSAVVNGIPASVDFVNGAGNCSYTLPATAFNFLADDAATLSYTATLADNTPLPAWLHFDTATGTFSGNPPHGASDISVKVTATASVGGSATTAPFTLTIVGPNDPLQLTTPLPDQTAGDGGVISILLDKPFTDPDGAADGSATKDGITYVATANGQHLIDFGLVLEVDPAGNPGKILISGNAPAGVSYLNIVLTGTETNGGDTETTSFTLNLGGTGATYSGAQRSNDEGNVAVTSNADIAAPKQGDILTAQAPVDADGVASAVSYQWQVSADGSNWMDVAGARGQATSLTLAQTEVGLQVRVQAFYLDGGGFAESPTSTALPATLDVNDPGSVVISAGSSVGSTISAIISDPDGLATAAPSYQWQRADSEGGSYSSIAGATYSSYTITSADGGKWLRLVTTYTDDQGNTESNITSPARNINLSQIAPVAANVAGTATEAGGVENGIAGSDATGSLRTGATDGNPGQAATLVVTGVRAGDTEGLGRPANDGGATFTISGEFGDLVVTKATGAYTYTVAQGAEAVQALNTGDSLTEKFNFTLQDVDGLSDTGVLTITINGANDKPTISGQLASASVVEDVPTALPLDVLSITDPDSNALTLTLSVTAGTLRVNSLDDTVAVSGNDTATLTLTVSSSPDALRGWLADNAVLYVSPANQTGAVATLSYSINDGSGAVAASGTTAITASAANDAVLVDPDGNAGTIGNTGVAVFKPRGEAVKLAPSLTLSDIDASALNLTSATVTLSSGAIDNQYGTIYEKLSLSAVGETARTTAGLSINVTESAENVVLTLTGGATLAQYQAVLREVLYDNSNPSAFTGDRGVTISVTDADGVLGNAASFKTTAANGTIAVGQRIFVNNQDSGAIVAAVENSQHFIASRPLSLSVGDTLKFYSAASQPAYAWGGGGELVLAGGDSPLTTATVAVSGVATVTVQVPWTPVVDLNGEASGRDHSITFTEGESGRAIATADSSITDQDGNLKQVTVTIANPQDGAAEKLFYTPAVATNLAYLGITVTGNNTHTLTFSGDKDASQFQPWLRAIQYVNTSDDPSIVPRQVVVTVIDAADNVGVPATTTVGIIPVNDAPVKGGDFAGALDEGAVYVFTTGDLNSTDVDNDNGTLKYVLTSTPAQGTLFRDINGNNVLDVGEAIATVGNSTSVTNINAIGTEGYFTQAEVAAGLIKYAHGGQNPNGLNPTGTDSFGFKVVDGMEDYAFANIATNQAGTVTLTITEQDDAATGAPVVSGTMTPSEVLTADVSTIADADGPLTPVFSYQWQTFNGLTWDNVGSDSSAYTLQAADQGKSVRVQVSFDDAFGRSNTLTGEAEGSVAYTNTPTVGTVGITDDGTPQAGETLTADTSGLSDADGLGPFNYQWQVYDAGASLWVNVGGATGKSFSLPGDAAEGGEYRVVVSYTDGRGNSESLASSAVVVAAATDINDAPSLTGDGAFPAVGTLFSNVVVSTVEAGQLIKALTLTVTGVLDVAEALEVDGEPVVLGDGISGTTSAGGVDYAVALAGTTATLTLTHAGLTEAAVKGLIEALTLSGGTSAGLRVVTLVSLQDDGGTASGGQDTGTIGISATVDVGGTLPGSNTAPTVSGDAATTVAEGGVVTLLSADLSASDMEQPDGLQVVLASDPTNGTLFRDLNGNGVVDGTETALLSGSKFALADIAAGRIKYLHDGSETLDGSFTFNVSDGSALSDADGVAPGDQAHTFNITVTQVDDAPTLSASALGSGVAPVGFTEGAAAVAVFSAANASPVETGENITGITIMVSGLSDGVSERLVVDGTAFALTQGISGTSTGGSIVGFSVSVTGGTALVTLTSDLPAATWNALIVGLAYENTSQNPTNGDRALTLTSVTETGGQSAEVGISSYVRVTAVNDSPTLTLNTITVTEGGSKTLSAADIVAADVDNPLSGLTYTLSAAPAEGSVYLDANANGVRDADETLSSGATFTHAQLTSGKLRYQHNDGESGDFFSVTVDDGQGGSVGPFTMIVNRTPVNDAPSIAGLGSDVLAYPANSGAKTLEQGGNVIITDPDSATFNGGNLRVSITFNRDPAQDVLSIANTGTGVGQIGVSGSTVTYGGTTIGSFSGGTGTSDLVISFNANATHEAVQALIEAVQFANGQAAPAQTSRTVSFALYDGAVGGQAAPVAVNVNIATGVTPIIAIANGFFIVENSQLVTALSATDPNGRPITFSISSTVDGVNNPDSGKFEIVSGNLLRFKQAPDFETPADAGGNNVYNVIVRATNDQGSFAEQTVAITVLDQNPEEGIAVGDTAGPVFGFATVNGTSLVMTYTDASNLDATNTPTADRFVVKVGGSSVAVNAVVVNSSAKTVTLTLATAVTAGQAVTVAYTDPTVGNDVLALQDLAGNDAATLADTTVSNVTPSTGGGAGGGGTGGGGSTPTTPTAPPEGAVTGGTTTTTTNGDGSTTSTTTGQLGSVTVVETVTVTSSGETIRELVYVPVGTGSGAGSGQPVTLPLLYEAVPGSDSNTTIVLPAGIGLVSVGNRTPTATGQELNLIELIQTTVPDSDSSLESMLVGGQSFLDGRSSASTLWVNKVVLTAPQPLANAPTTPIIVNGAANNSSSNFTGDKLEALVIDASALPAGTVLELQNVDFAVVLGDGIVVRGGNGANVVFGGAGSQNILLGPDDDVLYGGDGDDIVGSEGGADMIFGNAGNDTVFGGAGADLLHGGRDTDVATYSGSITRYDITRDHGKTIVRSLDRLDDIDTLINIESIRFDDATYTVQNQAFHVWIASLYDVVLGRQAELGGFQFWSERYASGESIGKIALSFLYSAEYESGSGKVFSELDAGQQIDLLYQHFLGREAEQAGHDYWVGRLEAGWSSIEIAEHFVHSVEMQQSYRQAESWEFFL